MTDTVTAANLYVTVRTTDLDIVYEEFYVNIIDYNGEENTFGEHGYTHKRSARRAAMALAKKLDISYRQDLEYSDEPYAFTASFNEVKRLRRGIQDNA